MPEIPNRALAAARSSPEAIFATTSWTLVVAAGGRCTPESAQALEELCRIYWYPLYAYVRRRGHSREDAEDLTQGFFARFLRKNYLEGLDTGRGRFRAYLLAALKNHLANEWQAASRLKRGGEAAHLSLDWQEGETRFQIADAGQLAPDAAYDREWATALLARVVGILREEWTRDGKRDRFERLKSFLSVEAKAVPYATLAAELEIEEGALRVAVHRLRKRYRELLKLEVARTLADPAMVDEELQALMAAFA